MIIVAPVVTVNRGVIEQNFLSNNVACCAVLTYIHVICTRERA